MERLARTQAPRVVRFVRKRVHCLPLCRPLFTAIILNERSNYGDRISHSVAVTPRRRGAASGPRLETRFDRRLAGILVHATNVFCDKGYAAASMRDLSRASGISLSGLYYYFESKEELLYLIQKHTFSTIVDRLRERLDEVDDPADRIRMFILNHLEYFLANQKAMKVLSHEDDVSEERLWIRDRSHQARVLPDLHRALDAYKAARGLEFSSRTGGAQPVRHDELDLHLV